MTYNCLYIYVCMYACIFVCVNVTIFFFKFDLFDLNLSKNKYKTEKRTKTK